MSEREIQTYESCFSITSPEITKRSIEKIYNLKEKNTILKCIKNKKYNKELFKNILLSLENDKDINKKPTIIDKIKYGIKPGKNWTMLEDTNDKKDIFIQRYTYTTYVNYDKENKIAQEVANGVLDRTKKEISDKCKTFEPLVKKEYPSSKAKLDFKRKEEKDQMDDRRVYSLLITCFEIHIPIKVFMHNQSSEAFNKKIEQNDINSTNKNYEYNLFSIEEGEEGGFEEAAGGGDEGGENQNPDGGAVEEPPTDDMMKNEPDENGEGGGMDDGSGDGNEGGFGDDSGDNNGENGNNDKKDVFDSNIGSSMNPFTQINQKIYQLETLNELRLSIKKTLDMYNSKYADWSEVCQLKELLKILDEERKSFMMQQNPENLLKLGLYHDQYDKLVQNISKRINKLVVNDRQ